MNCHEVQRAQKRAEGLTPGFKLCMHCTPLVQFEDTQSCMQHCRQRSPCWLLRTGGLVQPPTRSALLPRQMQPRQGGQCYKTYGPLGHCSVSQGAHLTSVIEKSRRRALEDKDGEGGWPKQTDLWRCAVPRSAAMCLLGLDGLWLLSDPR